MCRCGTSQLFESVLCTKKNPADSDQWELNLQSLLFDGHIMLPIMCKDRQRNRIWMQVHAHQEKVKKWAKTKNKATKTCKNQELASADPLIWKLFWICFEPSNSAEASTVLPKTADTPQLSKNQRKEDVQMTLAKQIRVDKELAKTIASDVQLFSTLDHRIFQTFFQALNLKYVLPSKSKSKHSYLLN